MNFKVVLWKREMKMTWVKFYWISLISQTLLYEASELAFEFFKIFSYYLSSKFCQKTSHESCRFFQIFCKTLIDTCQESRNFLRPWGLVIYIRKSSIRTRFSTRFSLNRIESVQTQTSILFFSSLLSFFCYCISFYFSLQVVRRETPF